MLTFFSVTLIAQQITVEPLLFLPDEVSESSGLIFLNDKIITHNDDGDPVLYELDPDNGTVLRKLFINGATNVDWEDLCIDQQFIYIGDIGNSHETRTDLRIYKVSLDEYFLDTNDTVSADIINISYSDQSSFKDNEQTNFDAAAMVSFGDSLYIFTKNWGDFHTNIYSIPKAPGDYQINRVGRINSSGLVAGAVYNSLSMEIMLIGYTGSGPFLLRIFEFENGNFANGKIERISFSLSGSFQIEGIETINETDYYISSETNLLGKAALWQVTTDFLVSTEDPMVSNLKVYPIPADRTVQINGLEAGTIQSIRLISTLGKEVVSLNNFREISNAGIEIEVGALAEGLYQLCITTKQARVQRKLLISRK